MSATLSRYSTVPAVKKALRDTLRSALPNVQVERQHPGDTELSEGIRFGDVRGNHQLAAMVAGRIPRDEEYVVDVYLESVRPGEDSTEAEERAFELLGQLEDLLADDNTIVDTLVGGWARVGSWTDSTYFDAKTSGWACTIRAEVAVKARLR